MVRFRHVTGSALTLLLLAGVAMTGTTAAQVRSTERQPAESGAQAAAGPADLSRLKPAEWERALQKRWGLRDIVPVSKALLAAGSKDPQTDGGLSYDGETLTYTQHIVGNSLRSKALTSAARTGFAEATAGSNLKLEFTKATYTWTSLLAAFTDLQAPEVAKTLPEALLPGLSMTVHSERNRVVVHVGTHLKDPQVRQFFDRPAWKGRVVLDGTAMVKEENRRTDSPSNGWSGGAAMCLRDNDTKDNPECAATWAPTSAKCTAGFSYVKGGQLWMLTAKHCVQGRSVANANGYRRYLNPRYTIGTIASAVHAAGDVDASIIRQSTYGYNNLIWDGGLYGEKQLEVTAADYETPVVGTAIRTNGANTGTQTGFVAFPHVTCDGTPGASVRGITSTGGDSGGPYTTANTATPVQGDQTAMGIHMCGTGGADGRPTWERTYTTLKDAQKALGGYVKTY